MIFEEPRIEHVFIFVELSFSHLLGGSSAVSTVSVDQPKLYKYDLSTTRILILKDIGALFQ